ncbi:M14 family metallopeptidase [Lichenifustis flavocetrariae]|uniref:M14 family metallopeptidase n=1 Tax=Lichenifustis flavocetrariae TaxID=2949735 RepID=A0AA42CM05_9HYPH|nr:M14 family metallopeptidase [Lichenifustis flavocetrariae]MCW6512169.1 M14 family metallopeptidase [Lichenifustis flavocetrariae]
MISFDALFPETYAQSRERILALARRLGHPVRTYQAPGKGPAGETLATDVLWIGPQEAEAVAVLVSATHGVEGFCGAGAQCDTLERDPAASLPPGVALLVVHAINPFGFAWLRRVTMEGVDLNRNGVDFAALPQNPGFDQYRHDFTPRRPGSPEAAAATARLNAFQAAVGPVTYQLARNSGQYVDPKNIFFGGREPTWSRRTLETIVADYDLRARKQVAVVDYHTGLGPYGYGEPICGTRPSEPGSARGRRWYGDSMTEPMRGTSTSVVIPGLSQYIWLRELGPDALTFIALEYGTYPPAVMDEATSAEHWLGNEPALDPNSEEARTIKARFRRAYYPDESSWKEMVIWRSRQIVRQTLQGLAEAIV